MHLQCETTFQWILGILVFAMLLHQVLTVPYRGRYVDLKCTDAATGRELLVGDAFTRPGLCVRVQCLDSLHLWEDRCQTPKLNGNCSRIPPANEFLDYPKCCPLYECKIYESNDRGETEESHTYDHYGNLRKTDITQVFMITNPGLKTQFQI